MTKTLDCQQKTRRWFKNDVIPPQACLNDPLEYILGIPKTEQKLFNLMAYLTNKYELCYYSQTTIGNMLGICRQHANTLLKNLVARKLLIKQKCYDDTSMYRLPKFFHKIEVCRILESIFTAFKALKNKILSFASLVALEAQNIKNATSILNPLRFSYKSSPCHMYIVEKLSTGDIAECISDPWSSKEKLSPTDSMKMVMKIIQSRMWKIEDQLLNNRIPYDVIEGSGNDARFQEYDQENG